MEAVISIVGSILGSLAGKAAEYTVDPIAQQLSYLFKPKSKFQNFRDQLQKLKDARERVQQKVNEAKRNGEEIFNDVDRWLTDVNGKISEEAALQFQEDEEKAKKRCFVVLCPNFKSRYQLSRKAEKEANTIAQLLEQNGKFDLVSYPAAPEGVATRPVKDYEDFESRTGAFNAVMEALKDSNLSIIGVYGMGGVGKTTLVKQVARQAKEENLFDEVVMASVTQSFDINRIQDQIAEELGGKKLDKQSDAGRAGELRNRLKNSKKVLVILDDVWVKLDLEAVGIPYGAEHKGCKILLTSRELRVLSLTKSQQNLAVDVLTEDEAWSLFEKMAGDIVLSPDLYPIATEVAKKCAGLPIAIVTVGKGMENKKNAYEWRSALQDLIRPSKRNFKGISADVYSAIELSYKFLEDEEHRPTFLLCSVMGHNAVIEDLLIYGKGLGIFHGVDSIQEARDKVLTLVSNLKASCLLLDGSTPKYYDRREHFDMHDVVRDVAISISSRDQHWLALGRDDVFKEWSDEETMRRCNLISLRDAKVSELPDELECPNLTFFSMVSENSSLKIPDNFFKGMQRLKVLDFAKMHFSSLPLSISSLKNLHTLCFSWCTLEDIAIIGELKNLEILNLRGSTTATLPREIGQLTKLKLLDLSWCDNLEVISANVLSSLSSLEELYLYDSFDGWEVEVERHDNPRSNASLVELNHLSHLVTLEVHIPNQQAIPKDNLFFEKLERYKISIGMKWDPWSFAKLETSRILRVELNESINLYDGVKMLQKIENLHINGVKNVENILHDPNTLRFSQLKTITVIGCHTLKNLFSVSGLCQLQEIEVWNCRNIAKIVADEKEGNIGDIEESGILEFPQLRTLKLWSLPELKIFYSAEERVSSSRQEGIQSTIDASSDVVTPFFNQKVAFPAIAELELCECNNLKYVFTSSTVKSFVQLKTLVIGSCNKIEEVISVTQGLVEEERVVFPKLEDLLLSHLPNLERFCCGCPIEFPSLKTLYIRSCDVLSTFHCDCTSTVGKSSNISMDHNLHTQIRVPQYLFNHKVAFPAIEELELHNCNNLKYVFTSSSVKSFVQLKTLQIVRCNKIEEVISVTQGLVEEERVVFPKLEDLLLSHLPNLERFCCGSPIEFPYLEKLQIEYCDVLSTFHCDCTSTVGKSSNISMDHNVHTQIRVPQYLFNHKVALPMLQHLKIRWLKNLERLWPNQLAEDSYTKLIQLELGCCHRLLNVFPLSMSTRLQRLNKLSIEKCELLEEIFEPQQDHSSFIEPLSPKLIQSFEFPQVTFLLLCELPKLKGFYHEMHTTNWPSLKEMWVDRCDKVDILFASHEKIEKSQQDVSIRRPLFWVNKFTFPNLESLQLGWNDGMKEIWYACGQQQLASDYLCKLKHVEFWLIPKKVAIIPLYFLQLLSLPNLEKLQISFVDCKEIFQSEGVGGEEMPTSAWVVLSRVTELRLRHLSELMHLWKEKEGFQNLRILEVQECPKLNNYLAPSSVSFQNLVTLKVQKCGRITKLITHSTAKTLVQLKEMSIIGCDRMKEIIKGSGDDEDEVKIEIRFPRLNSLKLESLPKLKSFCSSGNYTFAFPSLEKVSVGYCPNMKIFSQGDSNTPMLHNVCFVFWDEELWSWEGNLNSTIQQWFKERNEDENSDEDEEEENSDEDECSDEDEEDEFSDEDEEDEYSDEDECSDEHEEDEYSDEDEEDEYSDEDECSDEDEEDEYSEEDQDNPLTSNTKNPIEEVHNSVEDQGNPSTSNNQ